MYLIDNDDIIEVCFQLFNQKPGRREFKLEGWNYLRLRWCAIESSGYFTYDYNIQYQVIFSPNSHQQLTPMQVEASFSLPGCSSSLLSR